MNHRENICKRSIERAVVDRLSILTLPQSRSEIAVNMIHIVTAIDFIETICRPLSLINN